MDHDEANLTQDRMTRLPTTTPCPDAGDELQARFEAAVEQLRSEGPPVLRCLAEQTVRILRMHTEWTPCQRRARMRQLVWKYRQWVRTAEDR